MPTEGTPTHMQPTPAVAPLHECRECRRPFVVPTDIVDVVSRTTYRVELTCTNCGWSQVEVHEEPELEHLDRELDRQTTQMRAALDLWTLTRTLEEIDAFARALQDDLILPEDF